MRNVAMMLRKGDGVKQDLPGAEAMYRRAAEAGLPTAQADLADMLLRGEVGGRPNPKAALPLLQAAAAANHPIAQFQLAQMYETGQEGLVPQDLERARNLYASAAERGMKQAEERLKTIGPPTRRTNNGQQAPSAPSP
jgi:TPR repeat protein